MNERCFRHAFLAYYYIIIIIIIITCVMLCVLVYVIVQQPIDNRSIHTICTRLYKRVQYSIIMHLNSKYLQYINCNFYSTYVLHLCVQ